MAAVDRVAITLEEVEKSLAGQLSKLEEQIYNLKRQRLEALIRPYHDKLFAGPPSSNPEVFKGLARLPQS